MLQNYTHPYTHTHLQRADDDAAFPTLFASTVWPARVRAGPSGPCGLESTDRVVWPTRIVRSGGHNGSGGLTNPGGVATPHWAPPSRSAERIADDVESACGRAAPAEALAGAPVVAPGR